MKRYFVAGSETAWGAGGTANHYYRITDDSLRADQGSIYPDNIEHAEDAQAIPGPFSVRGDFGGYAEPYYFPFLLQKALGKWGASTIHAPSTVYTHSIVAIDSDAILERFFIAKGLGILTELRHLEYRGCMIEELRLESRMGQALMYTVTPKGRSMELVTSLADATVEAGYDAILQPWMHHEIALTHGIETLKVNTMRMSIRNQLADAYYTERRSDAYPFEGRKITGEISAKLESNDLIEKFEGLLGPTTTYPQTSLTPYALTMTYTTAYAFAGQGTLTGILKIYCPEVYLDTLTGRLRRRDTVYLDVPFTAVYNRAVNYGIRATIRTTHAKPL